MYELSTQPHPPGARAFDEAAMKMIALNGKAFGSCTQPDIKLFNAYFEWVARKAPHSILAPPRGDCPQQEIDLFWLWLELMIKKRKDIEALTGGERYEARMKLLDVHHKYQGILKAKQSLTEQGEEADAKLLSLERSLLDLTQGLIGIVYEDSVIADDYAMKVFKEHERLSAGSRDA